MMKAMVPELDIRPAGFGEFDDLGYLNSVDTSSSSENVVTYVVDGACDGDVTRYTDLLVLEEPPPEVAIPFGPPPQRKSVEYPRQNGEGHMDLAVFDGDFEPEMRRRSTGKRSSLRLFTISEEPEAS
jgi:hypothetical protein